MNQRDVGRLRRLLSHIEGIPFPSEHKTASITGYVGYVADMRIFMKATRQVLFGMLMERAAALHPESDLEEGFDYYNPDKVLDAIDAWQRRRRAASWELPQAGEDIVIKSND